MATFNFRGDKYSCDILDKHSSTCHTEEVNKTLITVVDGISKNKKPIAIKIDGIYHLLQGNINSDEKDYIVLIIINKFVLKKCKIEEPVKSNINGAMTFQQKWNAENNRARSRANNSENSYY